MTVTILTTSVPQLVNLALWQFDAAELASWTFNPAGWDFNPAGWTFEALDCQFEALDCQFEVVPP